MGTRDSIYDIPLTKEKNYEIHTPAGRGSLAIGTRGISKGKYDVWVEQDEHMNWDAFDGLYTPYGKQNAEKLPYGDWPRVFYYSGNDTGFAEWSFKRRIEEFHWTAHEDACIDLTNANISRLMVRTEESKIEVSIGDNTIYLSLAGNLNNFAVKKCMVMPRLAFYPMCSRTETVPYRLPAFKLLEHATCVDIGCAPMGQAFDCRSLLQFRNLKCLNLSGSLANLDALTELKDLELLGLRYVPELTGMPGLASWKNLTHFVGWNIEETAGIVLRAEGRKLRKEKEFDFFSVSNLRKKIWFTTEYGIPFSEWEEKKGKAATRAYKACLKEVKKAKTESEVREAIINFVETINQLPDIETTEREDTGTAVCQLIEASGLDISGETGLQWFDEVREF